MRRLVLQLVLCLPGVALAEPWSFGDPVTVAGTGETPHYHHLDGAGRQHVAASDTDVALVWEDDRSGDPQVYFAVKPHRAESFSRTYQLSDGEEAYEPSIALIGQGQWLAAWEQDGAVMARIIDAQGPGPITPLTGRGSRQVTLASDPKGRIAATWAGEHNNGQRVKAAELRLENRRVALAGPAVPVAPVGDHPFQGYPAAAWGSDGQLHIAWEDRRAGHTRLFHSWRAPGRAFASERQLNEHFAPKEGGNETTGLGSGVMRVTLAADSAGTLWSIWLDKRNANSGYAVWGASSRNGGNTFGPNQMVQDALGDAVPQWHASLAGGKIGFVAAWDDTREGWGDTGEPGDVLLSWNTDGTWSPDLVVPGASGEGYQGSPALALDPQGSLHLIWIERDDLSSPSRLRYLRATFSEP